MRLIWALALASCSAWAQQRFDVASVRVNRDSGCQGRWDFVAEHGTVTAENAPLLRIVSRAYELTDDRVSGPAWLTSECYDIRAKALAGEVPERELMAMLRELLKERLHLGAHHESSERPVFALLPDKGGVKITVDGDGPIPTVKEGRVLFMARTLHDLCERLGAVAGRPVVDRTGLTGRYVIVLTYSPLGSTSGDDIFTAVREQLGLRLESQRAPVDVLKIDSVGKVPTEN